MGGVKQMQRKGVNLKPIWSLKTVYLKTIMSQSRNRKVKASPSLWWLSARGSITRRSVHQRVISNPTTRSIFLIVQPRATESLKEKVVGSTDKTSAAASTR